jgi:hypothetical protein
MATTQRLLGPEIKQTVGERMTRGFSYLTLDPSPRLRRLREAQERAAKDPAEVIREAWLTVGTAIREALQMTRSKISSPEQ